jgi:RNA 3'-terminal phosphate cyclase (ATP)
MTIVLDGSQGEGGGQILRSALSLSMCTGTPFRIERIRAKRKKPGLLRQHLTAVNAAAEICGAKTEGAHIGSTLLKFTPGHIKAGDYQFAIGSAGSCTLVFQTVLPALLIADAPSRVRLQGGTHNPMAPPFHFLERAFVPLLRAMGADIKLELKRFGFYPAGGGDFTAEIQPARLVPLHLPVRGERKRSYAESFIAGVPGRVALRELEVVGNALGWKDEQLQVRGLPNEHGPGNALMITLEHEFVTEVYTAFGEKGVPAEQVAKRVVGEAREYLWSTAAVGEHLADQLLLPMALAAERGSESSFTCSTTSLHTTTNAEVIQRFLPVAIDITKVDAKCFEVKVRRR